MSGYQYGGSSRELWRMNITGWSPEFRAHCRDLLAAGVDDGTYAGDDRAAAARLIALIGEVEGETAATVADQPAVPEVLRGVVVRTGLVPS